MNLQQERFQSTPIGHTIVVEKSTLPVKTAQIIQSILYSSDDSESLENKTFSVISNPEFLAEGSAIENLRHPDRVLIGGEDKYSVEALKISTLIG